ncbi:phospholipase B [Guyanagaster necrorhizus]|uniref:Lysophospholipase n=1 Tax=Guyanagaster necrorhizus TaxID=856835 RepID=A0A9P7VSZ9_9AGAR|nr:phospholipase B [Guyanagaster necrorhizus MCA 3950]KAG7446364.1 phospholipase B [Guyanagaster necrorhizus MCA 3950]
MLPFSLLLLIVPVLAQQNPEQDSVDDYAPKVNQQCPDITNTDFIRAFTPSNQTLHPQEAEYIRTRNSTVISPAWLDWLGNGSQLGYDIGRFQGHFPTIGIAIPGGGLRSAQFGAGALNALDARNDTAKSIGTGGLLQVSSYIAGLSGGSWVTGSLFFNNFPTINDLVFGNGDDLAGWLLDLPFATPDGTDIFSDNNQYFFGSILWSIMAKANAGVDTSITDPWSRMISYHFLNQTDRMNFFTNDTGHGAGQLWSHIPDIPAFQNHQFPFPLVVADSRPVGSNLTTTLDLDAVVYEITPFELASYDPNLSAAVNLSFAGTHLSNGKPENGSACVSGFDQAGFVMGSSASLFNQILDFARNTLNGFSSDDSSGILYVLSRQLQEVRTRADDVANWPNPFNGIKSDTFVDSDKDWLELIDGSSNQENIPYGPLFVKVRGLDVIVTLDSSADQVNDWPNGTGLLFSAKRQANQLLPSHQQFPPIPQTPEAFIDAGVNLRPTFFGCDPVQDPQEYPLVIYIPQAPPFNGDDPVINSATFRLTYTQKHTRLFLDQVFNNTISGFTPNTTLADPDFPICLQCASVDRARYKVSSNATIARSSICEQCFKQYCYDPQNPPSVSELPDRKYTFVDPDPQGLDKITTFLSQSKFKLIGGLVGLAAFMGLLVGGLIWWRKRREKKLNAEYKRISALHEDDTLKRFSDYVRPEASYASYFSYELPGYRGSQ